MLAYVGRGFTCVSVQISYNFVGLFNDFVYFEPIAFFHRTPFCIILTLAVRYETRFSSAAFYNITIRFRVALEIRRRQVRACVRAHGSTVPSSDKIIR
jgi:hypothetical protein